MDASLDLLAREILVQRTERHVLPHGGHEELVIGILEDEADPRTQFRERPVADLESRDLQLAAASRKAVQVQHQRRLAGAVRPEDRHPLTVLHVQVHAAEGGLAVRVAVAQPDGADGAAHVATPAARRSGTSRPSTASTKAASARPKASGTRRRIRPSYPRASIAR